MPAALRLPAPSDDALVAASPTESPSLQRVASCAIAGPPPATAVDELQAEVSRLAAVVLEQGEAMAQLRDELRSCRALLVAGEVEREGMMGRLGRLEAREQHDTPSMNAGTPPLTEPKRSWFAGGGAKKTRSFKI